jgi:hypothetical protein
MLVVPRLAADFTNFERRGWELWMSWGVTIWNRLFARRLAGFQSALAERYSSAI